MGSTFVWIVNKQGQQTDAVCERGGMIHLLSDCRVLNGFNSLFFHISKSHFQSQKEDGGEPGGEGSGGPSSAVRLSAAFS